MISASEALCQNSLDNYAQLLFEYKYEDAQLQDLNNDHLNLQSKQLAQILYDCGQFGIKEVISAEGSGVSKFLNHMSFGYNQLYSRPYEANSFSSFFEAWQIAEELNSNNLRKLSLLGIFEVFNYQFRKTSEDRAYFLAEFKALIENNVDEYHFRMNSLLFELKQEETTLNYSSVVDFESFMQNFPEDHTFQPIFYSTVAPLLHYLDFDEKAVSFYEQSILLSQDKPFLKRIKFRSYIKLSEVLSEEEKYNEALESIKKAGDYKNLADPTRSNLYIHDYLSRYMGQLKDYEDAYVNLLKANDLKQEFDYLRNNIEISDLQVKYQTLEKEKQLLISEQKEKQNLNIALGLGGSLLAVSIFAFLIYKNTKRKQRIAEQEKEIEVQKTEKILKGQEVSIINAMISGQEKERQKLASDLHDNVGATLSAAKMQFEHLASNKGELPNAEELFEKTGELLEKAYADVRGLAHAKNSGVIAKKGLLTAVKSLAKNVSNVNTIRIDVKDFGLETRLENSMEITIFRIIQELVTNTIKYASASEGTISITQHDNMLNIIVEDNGIGFDPKTIERTDGMGLESIERRVEHLQGDIEIDSVIGRGTSVIIDIPL